MIIRLGWGAVLAIGGLALSACPPPVEPADPPPDVTPPPADGVGCDPLALTEARVCDNGRAAQGFSPGTEFCPVFWEDAGLDQGWETLSSRWTLDFSLVQPGAPTDSWEYRNIQGDELTADLPVDVIARVGTPCATASEPDLCLAALDALRPVEGFVSGCGPAGCSADYLAGSSGDEVFAVTDAASMRSFLGSIDSLPEALLLASAAVDGFGWSTGALRGGAARPLDDGYELLGTVPVWSTPFRADALRVQVTVDGTITVLDRALVELDCGLDL